LDNVRFKLGGRARGNSTEASDFSVPQSSATFGDIRSDRIGGTPHLRRQAIAFFARKRRGGPVDGVGQILRRSPNLQLPEVCH